MPPPRRPSRLPRALRSQFETLVRDHVRALAMRKQTDAGVLDCRAAAVRAVWAEAERRASTRRVFEYFVGSYRAAQVPLHSWSLKALLERAKPSAPGPAPCAAFRAPSLAARAC